MGLYGLWGVRLLELALAELCSITARVPEDSSRLVRAVSVVSDGGERDAGGLGLFLRVERT